MHFVKHWRAVVGASLIHVFGVSGVAAAPTITGIGTPPPGEYGSGQFTSVALIFSEPVTITGSPSIGVQIGSVTRQFIYASFNHSFRYQLQPGDNGTLNVTGPISLNGGTIKGADGTDASLSFTPREDPAVVYDTIPPSAPVMAVSPASPTSEQPFTLSGTAEPGSTVVFQAGSAANAIADANGNWTVTFGPRAAGNYVYEAIAMDRAGNPSAASRLTFTIQPGTPAPGTPVVTRLGFPADGIYGESTVRNPPHFLTVSVAFSAPVIVTGWPTVGLSVGSKLLQSGPPRNINGSGGTQVTQLVFEYTPSYGENGTLAITGPIMLNGGTIKGTDGRDASLSFAAQEAPGVIIDMVPPAHPAINGVAPASPTSEQSFTVSGTAEPGGTVSLSNEPGPTASVDANGNWSMTFPPRAAGTYTLLFVTRDRAGNNSNPPFTGGGTPVTITVQPTPTGRPPITSQPVSRAAAVGSSVTFTASTSASNATYQWQYNGAPISGATGSTLTIDNAAPDRTGLYTAVVSDSGSFTVSTPAILGLESTAKLLGTGQEVGSNIVHPNGNIYDQTLLQGSAITLTADPGQVSRASIVDLSGDIMQVEFSGAGALSIVLNVPTGPAPAENYNQPDVAYMKGHAGIVITGANETTNVSVFSVGRINAVNQSLFREGVDYHGVADLAFIAILSSNGNFGGIRAGNANFWSTRGNTGIYAPGVRFNGPVYLCEITATEDATPMLLLGSATDARIAGGDLLQTNGRAVQVSGLTQLRFVAGTTSHGHPLPAQPCRGRLEDNGRDVTTEIVSP